MCFLIVFGFGILEQWNSNSAAFHENNLNIWNTNGNISKVIFRNRLRGIYSFGVFSWCQKTGFLILTRNLQKKSKLCKDLQNFGNISFRPEAYFFIEVKPYFLFFRLKSATILSNSKMWLTIPITWQKRK